MKKLYLPKNVKNLADWNPFDRMHNLEEIKVDPDNPYYVSIDGILYTKDMKTLFHFPARKNITEYVIPYGIEIISHCCFNCLYYVKHIVFPETVKTILMYAFGTQFSVEYMTALRVNHQDKIEVHPEGFDASTIGASAILYVYSP